MFNLKRLLILLLTLSLAFLSAEDLLLLKRPIAEVVVSGNLIYSDEFILKQAAVETSQGFRLDQDKIEQDLKKIAGLGTFQLVDFDYLEVSGGVKAVFLVEENPLVQKINFNNMRSLETHLLTKKMRQKKGDQFNFNYLKQDILTINNDFKESSYVYSSVQEVQLVSGNVLKVDIYEPFINNIIITGNIYTKEALILREITTKPGDIYNRRKLYEDRSNVYALGYFDDVYLPELIPSNEADGVDVKLRVKEKKKNNINFGVGVSSQEYFGFTRLSLLNLFNTGERMTFYYQSGQEAERVKANYRFRYYNPWFYQKNFSLGYTRYLKFEYERLKRVDEYSDTINVKRDGFSVDLGYTLPFGREYKFIIEYKDEAVKEDTQSPRVNYINRSLAGTYIYDGLRYYEQTNVIRSGQLFKFKYERGGLFKFFNTWELNLGVTDVERVEMVYNYFLPLSAKGSLGVHYQYGATARDRDRNVLEGDEYSVGGINSVRGYHDGYPFAIGPKQTIVNLEYRYLFNNKFQGVLFYDWGNAYDDINVSVKEFKSGYGLGCRYILPVGPLSFDFGRGEDFWIFHFGLGYSF